MALVASLKLSCSTCSHFDGVCSICPNIGSLWELHAIICLTFLTRTWEYFILEMKPWMIHLCRCVSQIKFCSNCQAMLQYNCRFQGPKKPTILRTSQCNKMPQHHFVKSTFSYTKITVPYGYSACIGIHKLAVETKIINSPSLRTSPTDIFCATSIVP